MFTYEHVVKFHECDPAGIMFFGNVYFIAHDSYEVLINSRIPHFNFFANSAYAFPLIKSSAEYYHPAKQGQKLNVTVNTGAISGSSYTIEYNFFVLDKLVASVKTDHVCVLKEGFKKNNLPEEVKGLLLSLLK